MQHDGEVLEGYDGSSVESGGADSGDDSFSECPGDIGCRSCLGVHIVKGCDPWVCGVRRTIVMHPKQGGNYHFAAKVGVWRKCSRGGASHDAQVVDAEYGNCSPSVYRTQSVKHLVCDSRYIREWMTRCPQSKRSYADEQDKDEQETDQSLFHTVPLFYFGLFAPSWL